MVGSLATLSSFYTDNSPAARRRLRSTVENQGVRVNEQFLEAAQGVIQVGWLGSSCSKWAACAGQVGADLLLAAALSRRLPQPAPAFLPTSCCPLLPAV